MCDRGGAIHTNLLYDRNGVVFTNTFCGRCGAVFTGNVGSVVILVCCVTCVVLYLLVWHEIGRVKWC